jgi:surface carbohydrate biosynthesis protein (TIGR04326 family)
VSEWKSSLHGISAMDTCLKLTLFLKMLSHLPKQKIGIFIAENQPWELARSHAWRVQGHQKLIGIPHTVVRYWDLRYFHDPRSYSDKSPNSLPMPDVLAVNGPEAYSTFLAAAYPTTQLFEVEALRFLYLKQMENKKPSYRMGSLRILVCGDFLEKNNNQMISWLDFASKGLPSNTEYILKQHPACPISLRENSRVKYRICDRPLVELFMKCDVVFTSNSTSASIGAYISGLEVIQVLDGNSFNLSPLRGVDNVVYVKNSKELLNSLSKIYNKRPPNLNIKNFFHLDIDLKRWRALLGFGCKN